MKTKSMQAELMNNVIELLINHGKRINAIDNDLHDLKIKLMEVTGEKIPHKDTWYTIPDYCEYKGLELDVRKLKEVEIFCEDISDDLDLEVLEKDGLRAYHETVLDETFGIFYNDDDCEDGENDEDSEDDDCDACKGCLCYACPNCPAEKDK